MTHTATCTRCGATGPVEIDWFTDIVGTGLGAPQLEPADGDACGSCGEPLAPAVVDVLRHEAMEEMRDGY